LTVRDITDEEVLKDLFDQFDSEKRGLVSVEDFQRINDLVGERYSASELHEMVEYADKDKDGLINWEEFKTVVQKQFGGQA
jgi:Ca2+-binding EF-hand superfamily protein